VGIVRQKPWRPQYIRNARAVSISKGRSRDQAGGRRPQDCPGVLNFLLAWYAWPLHHDRKHMQQRTNRCKAQRYEIYMRHEVAQQTVQQQQQQLGQQDMRTCTARGVGARGTRAREQRQPPPLLSIFLQGRACAFFMKQRLPRLRSVFICGIAAFSRS
jgi:hypothetical protein